MPSRNAIEIIISAVDDASDTLGSIGDTLAGVGKTVAVGAAAVISATVAIGAGMLDLAKDAAPVQGIQNAFKSLAESAGQNSDKLLSAMDKASMGMVADKDLMLQYNKASQLVGSTLAGQLPDAYQYLAKVAASSGQDVGQLMDTLVQGIGRVTPRMLTQLGVTVDADAANKAYAASIGKNVDQLTKADKQTALFNATMIALKKNTANLPDVTNNASTKMQQFSIKLEDIKEHLGVALLPMLSTFMDLLSKLADTVLPIITPIIQTLGDMFTKFFSAIKDGIDPFTALSNVLFTTFGAKLAPIAQALGDIGFLIQDFIRFIQQGEDPIHALGDALHETFAGAAASAVGSFFINVSQWVTTVALPALQKFAAWFMQDALPAVVIFVQGTVIPAIQKFISILAGIWSMVEPVLVKVVDWFVNTGLPLAVNFIRDVMIPYVQKLVDGIMVIWTDVQPGLQQLFDWFVNTGLPIITNFITNVAVPIISKIIEIIGNIWTTVAPALGQFAKWFLEDVLPSIGNFIKTVIIPVVQDVINILKAIWTLVQPALKSFQDGITNVMNQVKIVIQPVIDFIQSIIDKFNGLKNLISGGVGALGGAANNATTAANLVASGQVSPQQGLSALLNAIGSEITGHALGMNNVPEDGLYKLHKGESVKSAAENQYGGTSGQIAINFYGGNGISNQADANDAGFMIVNALHQQGMNV